MEKTQVSTKNRIHAGRDWTKGNITKNLMSMSWPMMVSGSLDMLGPTIDLIWVGRIGADSIAGVGAASMIVMVIHSMIMGLYMGLRAIIARSIGAGDIKQANHIAQQSLVICLIYSVFIAIIGVFLSERILILLGVSPEVVAQGAPYLRIKFVGVVTFALRRMTESTMNASGDVMGPMWIAVAYRLLHLVLCPFLVFGWWIFPQTGAAGAATSNIVAQGVGGGLGLLFLFGGFTRIRLTLRNFRIDPKTIIRLMRVSLPASLTGMERTLGSLVLTWIMAPYGTLALAAHSLNMRIEQSLHVPGMAVGQAAGVLAGQNLGAKQPQQAEKTGWITAGLLSGFMALTALPVIIWAEPIIRIFSPDPALLQTGAAFLRIAAAGYFVMGLTSAFQQCITGAGDTVVPMIIVLVNMWAIQVPLALILPKFGDLGVFGVRWAIVAGTAISAIAYVIYFKMGRWKHKKV